VLVDGTRKKTLLSPSVRDIVIRIPRGNVMEIANEFLKVLTYFSLISSIIFSIFLEVSSFYFKDTNSMFLPFRISSTWPRDLDSIVSEKFNLSISFSKLPL
jgi:hypothetical protein